MFKRNDIILITVLLVLSLTSLFALKKPENSGKFVVISVNNKQKGKYSLSENQTIDINELGQNRIVIKDGYCYVTKADCRDQICVNHEKISKSSQTIICLPNKVVIEVE